MKLSKSQRGLIKSAFQKEATISANSLDSHLAGWCAGLSNALEEVSEHADFHYKSSGIGSTGISGTWYFLDTEYLDKIDESREAPQVTLSIYLTGLDSAEVELWALLNNQGVKNFKTTLTKFSRKSAIEIADMLSDRMQELFDKAFPG